MLGYGRVAGQLSRITRHAHHKNFSEPFGFINVNRLRYSSKTKKTKPNGTTATVEECVPKKTFKKVPPLPPIPPPPPPHASAPPVAPPAGLKVPERVIPPCEDRSYSCPPDCPIIHADDCYKPGSDGKGPEFKYWKHIIAAVILAGASAFAYVGWFMNDDDKKDKGVGNILWRKKLVPNPKDSSAIPPEVPYLLIGGGTAAFSAFRAIKSSDPTAKVLVISNEGDFPYMRPPLSKELWYNRDDPMTPKLMFKQWNGTKRSLFYEPPEFYLKIGELANSEKGGVAVARGWNVKKIDVPNKTAYLEDGYQIKYEKCLLATGASAKNVSVFEKTKDAKVKEKVIVFRTKEDYLELVQNMQNSDVKNIVVVGGGFLGSELSTSLVRNLSHEAQQVYQIYKEKHILAQVLPEYLSEWTTKHSITEGVTCIPNVEVHDCCMKNGRVALTLTDGSVLEADQIVVAIGVQANTELAKESNLEVDPEQGGFLVNAELEARSNLWVAGDAACFYDVQLGRRRIEHHDHAVISGRLAGENMTGAGKPYLHQSMFWSDLGPEVGFEAIGIIDSSLETVGVFAKASEQDTPKAAAVNASADGQRLSGEEKSASKDSTTDSKLKSSLKVEAISQTDSSEKNPESESQKAKDDYGKGVIFYVRNNMVVGIVLWNIFNRMSIARQLLKRGTTYDEINEAAKLFAIHED